MTTIATTQTPYRVNAAVRPRERLALSRRVVGMLVALPLAALASGALVYGVTAFHVRDEIAATNEVRAIQREAVSWRVVHPLGCPTLADLRLPPAHADPWNTAYTITCTEDTTTVFSAGPDRTYFTADDPRYPK